jgi:hypothetical protein
LKNKKEKREENKRGEYYSLEVYVCVYVPRVTQEGYKKMREVLEGSEQRDSQQHPHVMIDNKRKKRKKE